MVPGLEIPKLAPGGYGLDGEAPDMITPVTQVDGRALAGALFIEGLWENGAA